MRDPQTTIGAHVGRALRANVDWFQCWPLVNASGVVVGITEGEGLVPVRWIPRDAGQRGRLIVCDGINDDPWNANAFLADGEVIS